MLKEALLCLALNIYYEANTEPIIGKFAVAHVTMNRVRSEVYPDSICKVVYQDSQFSWTLYKQQKPSGSGWAEAKKIASLMIYNRKFNSTDPTGGALYYHNTSVRPHWSFKFKKVRKIGNHIFYVPKKRIA